MPEFWHSTVLPYVESRRSCQQRTCYRPHSHDRFAIGLIDLGTTRFTGSGGAAVALSAGDVILIPAGHVHACNPDQGRWEYQMIQVDQDWIIGGVPRGLKLTTAITIFRHRDLYRRFARLNDRLFADTDPALIESELGGALGAAALIEPWRRLVPDTDAALLDRLRPVLHLLAHEESTPLLDELAEVCGMDKYQLIRMMKQATGLPPVAWRQNDRVNTARSMLRAGRSLAETAHTLGFTDQSHFHRIFSAHVAASPGSYRR